MALNGDLLIIQKWFADELDEPAAVVATARAIAFGILGSAFNGGIAFTGPLIAIKDMPHIPTIDRRDEGARC